MQVGKSYIHISLWLTEDSSQELIRLGSLRPPSAWAMRTRLPLSSFLTNGECVQLVAAPASQIVKIVK